MEVQCRLTDLRVFHPELAWDDAILAAAAIVGRNKSSQENVYTVSRFQETVELDELRMRIDVANVSPAGAAAIRRTYEVARVVELSAIAVTALAIYYGMDAELIDVAQRGLRADFLLKDGRLLEVAGRSRVSDLDAAWRSRVSRLKASRRYAVCVVEFETQSARLGVFG
jgi:hypothetical protein